MMWDRGYGMMDGYGWIGGLITLFFWVIVAVAVVLIVMYLVRNSGSHQGAHHGAGGGQFSHGMYTPNDRRMEEERRRYDEDQRRYQEYQQAQQYQQQPPAVPAQPYQAQQRPDEAVDIARRRFAAGEITREEFDDIVRTLGGGA